MPVSKIRAHYGLLQRIAKTFRMQADAALPEAAAEEAPAAFATAQISDEQSSVSFHVPRKLDIPSDGSRHGTVVAIEQLPVSIEYLAVPKLSPAVFLRSAPFCSHSAEKPCRKRFPG